LEAQQRGLHSVYKKFFLFTGCEYGEHGELIKVGKEHGKPEERRPKAISPCQTDKSEIRTITYLPGLNLKKREIMSRGHCRVVGLSPLEMGGKGEGGCGGSEG